MSQPRISSNTLFIKVSEYPVVNQLIIIGEPRDSFVEQIQKIISLKEKKSFIRSFLSKDITIIKSFYSSLGYNFANVDVKSKVIDQDNLDLIFEISRGEQTKISTISFRRK
jgi:outer membrane protein assembly factor BamA